jgi:predicted methyltransferase
MRSLPYLASVALVALSASPLTGCVAANAQADATAAADTAAIAAAVAAPTRTPANLPRDQYRHPAQTLAFFGLRSGETVVELWPSGGWYSEILAPLTRTGGGRYYVAGPWERGLNGARRLQAANAAAYGHMTLAEFPAAAASTNPRVPDGSADVVLTFRNIHNWRFGGIDNTQAAFRQIFAMLRPGGRLGIEEHRLPEGMASALEETSGYMKVSSVRAFAEAAGFHFVGASEVNANPRDTHDYAEGVWTLPPTLTAGAVDRDRYIAIGESDRMTLLFVKPEA